MIGSGSLVPASMSQFQNLDKREVGTGTKRFFYTSGRYEVDEYIQFHTLTICRVGAPVLELPVHLGERTWLAEAVDAAVGAWLRRQAVRRPELAAVGAGVEAVEQAQPRVLHRAVDRTSHTTGCIYTTGL